MKKIISILFAIICFLSLLILTIVLNINLLTKHKNIVKQTKNINYIELVSLNTINTDNKEIYDEIYYSLQKSDLPLEKIIIFYESDYIKEVFKNIIYNSSNYLFYNKEYKKYNVNTLNKLADKKIKDKELREQVKNINYNFVNMENNIKYNIDSIDYNKIRILRYIMDNKFKVILLSLIMISIIIEIILNKEKIIPYIFTSSTICSIVDIIISISLSFIVTKNINNEFVLLFIKPFVEYFDRTLLITGLVMLIISTIYLMINQKIDNITKIVIKPRIKVK